MGLRDLLMEREKRKCEESLHEFFLQAWETLQPGTELVDSWHYELISQYLELITRGEFRKRWPEKLGLTVNVAPRTRKIDVVFDLLAVLELDFAAVAKSFVCELQRPAGERALDGEKEFADEPMVPGAMGAAIQFFAGPELD